MKAVGELLNRAAQNVVRVQASRARKLVRARTLGYDHANASRGSPKSGPELSRDRTTQMILGGVTRHIVEGKNGDMHRPVLPLQTHRDDQHPGRANRRDPSPRMSARDG